MGQNSTEVAYGFGQMGSVFNNTVSAITPPTNKVFSFIGDTAKAKSYQAWPSESEPVDDHPNRLGEFDC